MWQLFFWLNTCSRELITFWNANLSWYVRYFYINTRELLPFGILTCPDTCMWDVSVWVQGNYYFLEYFCRCGVSDKFRDVVSTPGVWSFLTTLYCEVLSHHHQWIHLELCKQYELSFCCLVRSPLDNFPFPTSFFSYKLHTSSFFSLASKKKRKKY